MKAKKQNNPKRFGRVNLEFVEDVYLFYTKGLSTGKIATIMGTGTSTIETYFHIFRKLERGEPINRNPHTFSESAIIQFCEVHGFRYVRAEPQTPAVEEAPEQISADEIIASAPSPAAIAEESSSENKVWGLVVQFVKAMPEHVRARDTRGPWVAEDGERR